MADQWVIGLRSVGDGFCKLLWFNQQSIRNWSSKMLVTEDVATGLRLIGDESVTLQQLVATDGG